MKCTSTMNDDVETISPTRSGRAPGCARRRTGARDLVSAPRRPATSAAVAAPATKPVTATAAACIAGSGGA